MFEIIFLYFNEVCTDRIHTCGPKLKLGRLNIISEEEWQIYQYVCKILDLKKRNEHLV